MSRLPLHEIHAAAGARFGDDRGAQVPLDYGNPADEYRAARESVALFDWSDAALLVVRGGDRVRFLQGMVTNDVAALADGQRCLACLCNDKGGIQAVVDVWRQPDAFWLFSDPGMDDALHARLDRYIVADDVTLDCASAAFGKLTLLGPGASDALATLAPAAPDLAPNGIAALDDSTWLARRAFNDLDAFLVVATTEALPALADRVVAAVRNARGRWAGRDTWDLLRIEAGWPRWGREISEDTFPQEVGLADAVSFTKGCYIGQEVVLRIQHRGHVNRQLVRVVVDGDCQPLPAELSTGGKVAGRLTSAARFPDGRSLGLALVRREAATPGARLALPGGAVMHIR